MSAWVPPKNGQAIFRPNNALLIFIPLISRIQARAISAPPLIPAFSARAALLAKRFSQ
jgi:hypothetical protein